MERTLSIIKPDVASNQDLVGLISTRIEHRGLKIIKFRKEFLAPSIAREFYAEHQGKGFFDGLVEFMSSGMIIVQLLEGENAVAKYREMIGVTDPKKAKNGTIRALFGTSIRQNVVHGSDSAEAAEREIKFFFPEFFA